MPKVNTEKEIEFKLINLYKEKKDDEIYVQLLFKSSKSIDIKECLGSLDKLAITYMQDFTNIIYIVEKTMYNINKYEINTAERTIMLSIIYNPDQIQREANVRRYKLK